MSTQPESAPKSIYPYVPKERIDLRKLKELSDELDRSTEPAKDDDSTLVEPFPVEEQHSVVTQVQNVLDVPVPEKDK